MRNRTKIAIPVITLAALGGASGIAYANVYPTPTPSVSQPIVTPSPSVTPSPTLPPFVNPLIARCYRATDFETVVAVGHAPVRETVSAIVCLTRRGTPVVFVDTNAGPFPTPFPFGR